VSPGASHEALKERLAGLLETAFVALDIPFQPFGSVTLKRGSKTQKGTEADSCYYLTNIDRVRGKNRLRMGFDPPPDLALEVVVTHPVSDALKVHSALGVREVWVCKHSDLEFLVLEADGHYTTCPTSRCLPIFSSAELAPWVFRQDLAHEATVRRLFLAWVSDVLAPRYEESTKKKHNDTSEEAS
jgi:Uma2 family endonuclease